MSGYLAHLVARTLQLAPQVRPVLGTRFAPGPELVTDRAELPAELRQPAAPLARPAAASHRQPSPAAALPADRAAPSRAAARAADPLERTSVVVPSAPSASPLAPEPRQSADDSLPPAHELQLPAPESWSRADEAQARARKPQSPTHQPPAAEGAPLASGPSFKELLAVRRGERELAAGATSDWPVLAEPSPNVTTPAAERAVPKVPAAPPSEVSLPAAAARQAQTLKSAPPVPAVATDADAPRRFLQRIQTTLSAKNAEVSAAEPAPPTPVQIPAPTSAQISAQISAPSEPAAEAAQRSRQPDEQDHQSPIIRVHINRIEVRAPAALVPTVTAAPAASAPGTALSQYLEQRRKRS